MKAYIFPGQGAQFVGMGKTLYESSHIANKLFHQANEILGFNLVGIMFEGEADDLRQTKVTQPSVFLHSVASALALGDEFRPDMVAGHSLGEFSALVASGALSFEDGLKLVSKRATAMQHACEMKPSTMAAIIALSDNVVEKVCMNVDGIVVPANYNCPGQLVISGEIEAIDEACARLKEAGARRALKLSVGGAFHSPLMEPARANLAKAIEETTFLTPRCPVYQNYDAKPHMEPSEIKANLISQLTAPVLWSQIVNTMISSGATEFVECGPGQVLTGLVKKIDASVSVSNIG